MARKPGTTGTTTKRGNSRRKPTSTSTTAGARGRLGKTAEANETTDGGAAATTKATRKRQTYTGDQRSTRSGVAQREAGAEQRGGSQGQQNESRGSKLKSVLSSSIVRSVVAAGFATAATAILYRKTRNDVAGDQGTSEARTELLPGEDYVEPATYTARTKAGRRTAAAAGGGSAGTTSTTKAPRRGKASDSLDEPALSVAEQPTRKRRSDAGVKRTSRKTRAEVGAPSGIESVAVDVPASLNTTETSVFAPDAVGRATTDTSTSVADEQLAEAHPS